MTFQLPPPPPGESPSSGPERPGAPRRVLHFGRVSRGLMAGGLALGLTAGGYGIAAAATSSSSSSSSGSSGTSTLPAPPKLGPRALRPGRGISGGRIVHGSFTEQTPSGSYETVEVQVGTVQSVSSTSITLKSADGYTHTYAVTSSTIVDAQRDGISSVSTGDTVRLSAETVNGTDTAMSITDTTKIGSSRQSFGFGKASTGASAGTTGLGPVG
jgi:hypothetical protein